MKFEAPPKHELTHIFGCKVEECTPLTKGFGLRVQLETLTDLAETFTLPPILPRRLGGYANSGLHNLAKSFGVVVIDNAFVNKDNSALLSRRVKGGVLWQDLWHWDSSLEGYGTILHNPLKKNRAAPTYFAETQDVRLSLGAMNIKTMFSSKAIRATIRKMRDSRFRFSVDDSEESVRGFLLRECPDLTQQIADGIPKERLYAHVWTADRASVTVHYNEQNTGILHARPKSHALNNPLQAVILHP
jgi:hypothetical protein